MRKESTPARFIFNRESIVTREFCKEGADSSGALGARRSFHYGSRAMGTNAQAMFSTVNTTSIAAAVERLGKNIGGYFGDGIDIAAVLAEQKKCARSHGWEIDG